MTRQAYRLAGEVAEATRTTTGRKRGYPNELIQTVKRLERMRLRAFRLRRELKRVEKDIKHERKMLRALAGAEEGESVL